MTRWIIGLDRKSVTFVLVAYSLLHESFRPLCLLLNYLNDKKSTRPFSDSLTFPFTSGMMWFWFHEFYNNDSEMITQEERHRQALSAILMTKTEVSFQKRLLNNNNKQKKSQQNKTKGFCRQSEFHSYIVQCKTACWIEFVPGNMNYLSAACLVK